MIEHTTLDTAEQARRRARHSGIRKGLRHEGRRVIGLVEVAEDMVHYAVALVLVAIALVVLGHSVLDLFDSEEHFAKLVTDVINSILFVIIVMEILRTVVAHFDDAGLQLKPFLIIGIISAVRHILTVGAQASLGAADSDASHAATDFSHSQVELGVNAAVVMALVLGLVLVWRSERVSGEVETDTTAGLS
jgi:uncharacterized membrane protein (DUF373 family)